MLKLNRTTTKVATEIKSTNNPKVAVVFFSDGTKAMTSAVKHYNPDGAPKFLNEKNELLAGWDITNDWLRDPQSQGGVTLSSLGF
jgi:hypothetical protein